MAKLPHSSTTPTAQRARLRSGGECALTMTKSRASRQRRRSDHALHSASGHAGQVNQLAVEKKCRKFSAALACGWKRIARHALKASGHLSASASGQLSATTSAAAAAVPRKG